ncbi:hypothetical protein CVG87_15930 [Pseudomonas sp. WCS365]|nr:hypothetical protein CVG87_15930 [Pseudomonas sp. WCS365]
MIFWAAVDLLSAIETVWGGVYIRFCGKDYWRFRSYSGSLLTGPASGLLKSEPPSGRNPKQPLPK